MSVTRGEFLKQLGKSLPGMVLGGGVALAAQKVLGKMAAVSDMRKGPGGAGPTASVADQTAAPADFMKSGPTTQARVALTFDDGPSPGVTDLILDQLKLRQARATFFMVGQRVVRNPDLVRRVLAEGHEIGNHSFTHPHLNKLPQPMVEAEIQRTQEVIFEATGQRPIWFRPPYGHLRADQAGICTGRGLRVVLWNIDPADWAQPGVDKIRTAVLGAAKPGAVILCHDLYRQTSDAVGPILDGLTAGGLECVTLSALME